MGKSPNGPYGPTNGKIGNLVSYKLRGQAITRTLGVTRKKRSLLQLGSSQRLTVVNAFLKPIKGFINLGFLFEAEGTVRHQYSAAMSYNLKNATEGVYPNQKLKHSSVMVSIGVLKYADGFKVVRNQENLDFEWSYDKILDFNNRNDRTMILLTYSNGENPIYLLSGSLRSEMKQKIELGMDLVRNPCHIYLAFLSEDRLSVSNSQYLHLT